MPLNDVNNDVLSLLLILLIVVTVNNRHRLTSSALVHPSLSPWIQLLSRFSRFAFVELERALYPLEDIVASGKKRGRPVTLNNKGKLGLYLLFVTSRMEIKFLCLIFGIPSTTCIRYINNMMKLVVKKLKNNPVSKIHFPDTDEEKEHFASLIAHREPSIRNCIGFVDGASIAVQCSNEVEAQNKDYNGYKHDTNVNNVLAFAPTGKVIYAALNYPGSWHDSTVCAGLIDVVVETIGAFCM